MHWYFDVLKKYAVFSGRASRAEYWWFVFVNIIVYLLFVFLGVGLGFVSATVSKFGVLPVAIAILYNLVVLIPTLAVTIRRLHDIGKSGWWVLIGFAPFVGGLILFIFTLLDSQAGTNQYGPNPKGVNTPGSAPTI